jgi:hypothetical protein
VALRVLADRSGLSGRLSTAMAVEGFSPVHDRGRVLADAAVMIADGGRVMSDLAVLRDQGELFGSVASDPTLWRTLAAVDQARRDKIAVARAKTRAHVWSLIIARHGAIPAAKVADTDLGKTIVIRLDASIVISHSQGKEQAAGTFKKTFGHHPLTAWCDNTGESLAVKLRPGNAGANTVTDHLEVLTAAINQIPAAHRRDMLITCDGAGATLDLLAHITKLNAAPGRRVHYSVGFDLDSRARTALAQVPAGAWQHVLDPEGKARDLADAGVVELTALMRERPEALGKDALKNWPAGMRVIARRERPLPGVQLSLFEQADGWRYQLFATNTPAPTPGRPAPGRLGQLDFLEARHRVHARVEDRIRTAKATGLGHLPSKSFTINQAWLIGVAIACDLLAWLRLLLLTGPLAAAEPKTLRYRLLHVAARLIRGQRKRTIRIPETWPWATELSACLTAAFALPPPPT